MTDTDALREALLEALLEMARSMRNTVEGRETVAALYELRAQGMKPVVAKVLLEAAEKVRSG
ncbi:hypothetical protein [Paracoccus fontiphilus]|uniref:Uncharacterized protein n=1 Tax=Paracoccus fontiphilus TaxID=1815556 RepID=A0ABV7IJN1_9RHOB|nr:hypothetical protein [Paracoccus fontiphilus]